MTDAPIVPKRPRGRPTRLTPESIARFATAVRMGINYEQSCQYAGFDYSTYRTWVIQAEALIARLEAAEANGQSVEITAWEQLLLDLMEAYKSAEAEGIMALLACIREAANGGHWQAAAWILERRYPHIYGRFVNEITGPNGGPITTANLEVKLDLTDEERRELLALAHDLELITPRSSAKNTSAE